MFSWCSVQGWGQERKCSAGPGRGVPGRLCWELWLQLNAPTSFPSASGGKRLLSSWTVYLLWISEREHVHCECLGKEEEGRRLHHRVSFLGGELRFPMARQWSRDSRMSCEVPPVGPHSRIRCRPELNSHFCLQVVERWLKSVDLVFQVREGLRSKQSEGAPTPSFYIPWIPLSSLRPASQHWVPSCCLLAPQRLPWQDPSWSAFSLSTSVIPFPSTISSPLTSKISFSLQHSWILPVGRKAT